MAINNVTGTQSGSTLIQSVGVPQGSLATGGAVTLVTSVTNGLYRILDININFGGTNFSGGGGDRNLSITDGTKVYSVIPAAALQALVNARWGSTQVPLPASIAMNSLTTASGNIRALYSGGTTDYSAGQVTITIAYQFMGLQGS